VPGHNALLALSVKARYNEGTRFPGLFRKPSPLPGGSQRLKTMVILLTIIHVIVCLFLIIVVLLQSGQSGDIAAAFGGMGSQTAFGPRGAATVLTKATTWCAVIFMITSISLSVLATRKGGNGSVLQNYKAPASNSQPTKK
jgi:preprotein translocase subunit SecG